MRIRCRSLKSVRAIKDIVAEIPKKEFPGKDGLFAGMICWNAIIDIDQLSEILKLDGVSCEITEDECPYIVEHAILRGWEKSQ